MRLGPVAVLGAGSWGTTLAVHLAELGHDVRLWARDADLAGEMARVGRNPVYLPDIEFPSCLRATAAMPAALHEATCVVSAVPSHGTRDVIRQAGRLMPDNALVVSTTKGLEPETLLRASEVLAQELGGGRRIAVISGPSFAVEMAHHRPTAVAVASRSIDVAEEVQREFRARYFRLYASDDVVGVETGGALKNIIAIAAGVVESLGLGPNALAALITRGLAEMSRLACALGGRRETLAGLSGLGDLVLTCTGTLSRNRHVGIELGRGRALDDILKEMKMVAEGVRTTSAALALGARLGVELPIACQMAEVLEGRKNPRDAVEDLMLRPQRSEH